MRGRFVELEEQRLKAKGYECVVSSLNITISEPLEVVQLMNDSYILMGVLTDRSNQLEDMDKIILSSPTDCLQVSLHDLPMLGTGILRKFRGSLIVKTCKRDGSFNRDNIFHPYTLQFIRITPFIGVKQESENKSLISKMRGF